MPLPKIVILTTGGTIVSSGATATQMTGYSISHFSPQDLLNSVPQLRDIAEIETEAVSNIDSSSMTSDIWIKLAHRIEELAFDPDVAGFVITHGTDTMEETGYFLNLTVHTDKPIVLTGAMRPASAISADGPLHLYNAVRVAACPQSRSNGVLICLNDKILSARDAYKSNPTNVETFTSDETGALGFIEGDTIEFFRRPIKRHTTQSEFSIPALPLPRVDIIVSHTDDDDALLKAALAAGAQGIVHMGTGNGSIHGNTEPSLLEAAANNIPVVRASRTTRGLVVNGLSRWQEAGFIPSGSLSAAKARILLQVALTKTKNARAILRIFKEY